MLARPIVCASVLLAGCGDDPRRPGPVDTGPIQWSLDCEPKRRNGLLVSCELDPHTPGAALELQREGDPRLRRFALTREGPVGEAVLWGMRGASLHSVRAVAEGAVLAEASFTTGGVPDGVTVAFDVTGAEASQLDAVALTPRCMSGTVVLVDTEGFIIGFVDVEALAAVAAPTQILGSVITDAGTLVAVLGRSHIVEVDLAGRLLMHLERGRDFELPVHHTLYRRDGFTYALRAEAVQAGGQDYIMDGVYVFDTAGALVADWSSAGRYDPWPSQIATPGYWGNFYPGAHDFTHANSIYVDDAGDWLVSFKHMNAVAKIRGDRGAADFGDILWTLAPDPDATVPSDFEALGGGDPRFQQQHDVSWTPRGTLLLFDNGYIPDDSRGAELVVDDEGMTVGEDTSFEMQTGCPIQGGAVPIPGGNRVFTCAASGVVKEFDPAMPEEPIWTMKGTCLLGQHMSFPRAAPVRLY